MFSSNSIKKSKSNEMEMEMEMENIQGQGQEITNPIFKSSGSHDFEERNIPQDISAEESRFYDFGNDNDNDNDKNDKNDNDINLERLVIKGPDGSYQPKNHNDNNNSILRPIKMDKIDNVNNNNSNNDNCFQPSPPLGADGLPGLLNVSQVIENSNNDLEKRKRTLTPVSYFTAGGGLTIDTEKGFGFGKMLGPMTPRTPMSPFMPISPTGSFYSMIGEPISNSKQGPIYKVIQAVAVSNILIGLIQFSLGLVLFQYGDTWGSWYAGMLSVMIGALGLSKTRKIIRIYRVLMIGCIFTTLIAAMIDVEVLNLLNKADDCGTSYDTMKSYPDDLFGDSCGFHNGCSCMIMKNNGNNRCLNFETAHPETTECTIIDSTVGDLLSASVPVTWILFTLNIAGTLTGFLASDIILTGRQIVQGY